jgi:hypothetical protein
MARARLYELDESAIQDLKPHGQAALIITSLQNKHPQAAQDIADDIKSKLQTRQDPLRVVSYYLSVWKKSGIVNVVGQVGEKKSPVSNQTIGLVTRNADNEPKEVVVELDDEAPPTNPDEGRLDLVNSSLEVAVSALLAVRAEPAMPKELADELQQVGRTVKADEVRNSLRKLQRSGDVAKNDSGYFLVTPAPVGSSANA